jgi:hypothetical protein
MARHIDAFILEPRMSSTAGHYAELARAIVAGACGIRRIALAVPQSGLAICREFAGPFGSNIEIEALRFDGGSVLAEAAFTGARAREGQRVLVMTAKGAHAMGLSLCVAPASVLSRMSLLFHWPARALGDRALHHLGWRARQHCLALATTPSIASSLRSIGWRRVREVPYPMIAPAPPTACSFSHVLLAGPLRLNKGLPAIVGLVERWAAQGESMSLMLQSTPKWGAKHGRLEKRLLDQITRVAYGGLQSRPTAEDRSGYLRRFHGALTLVAYDPAKFSDHVSGVSLDALLCGSPIIASEGTLAADLVREFGAGEVVPYDDATALDEAIHRVVHGWDQHSGRAREAAEILAKRHHPRRFVEAWLASD